MSERYPDDGDPFSAGYNCCWDKLTPEIERITSALLEMRNRDDRNGSLPEAYRKIIDLALTTGQTADKRDE